MSAQKIERLTDEQVATLPFFADRWVQIGLSVERTDRIKAEEACKKTYEMAGFSRSYSLIQFVIQIVKSSLNLGEGV